MDGEIELNPLFVFREEGETDGRIIGSLKRTRGSLIHVNKLLRAKGREGVRKET